MEQGEHSDMRISSSSFYLGNTVTRKHRVDVYHGLCLKCKPWSCGYPVWGSLTDNLTEQSRTDMSAKPATGVE